MKKRNIINEYTMLKGCITQQNSKLTSKQLNHWINTITCSKKKLFIFIISMSEGRNVIIKKPIINTKIQNLNNILSDVFASSQKIPKIHFECMQLILPNIIIEWFIDYTISNYKNIDELMFIFTYFNQRYESHVNIPKIINSHIELMNYNDSMKVLESHNTEIIMYSVSDRCNSRKLWKQTAFRNLLKTITSDDCFKIVTNIRTHHIAWYFMVDVLNIATYEHLLYYAQYFIHSQTLKIIINKIMTIALNNHIPNIQDIIKEYYH
jgi:hypothetical protein